MSQSEKFNFAIIGCGRIAQRHAEHIDKFGKLTAVCDIISEKAETLAKNYGAEAYTNTEELLKNVKADVISICTPNGFHAEHSIKSLNAGLHVLCEKPMAITVEDCRKMISASEKVKKHLFIVKQNRFNPPVAAVKKI